MASRTSRKRVRSLHPTDVQSIVEGIALDCMGRLFPRKPGTKVTSSIAWVPKKPTGTKGWLRLSERRHFRAAMVRGKSDRTPKLEASYVRAFG